MREFMGESLVLQDAATICHRAARQTGQSTVDVQTCRTIKVTTFEISRSQKAPDADILRSFQSLRRANTSHFDILKWCEHPIEHLGRPNDIIVDKDGDLGRHFGDGPTHLSALIGFSNAQYPDLLGIDRVGHFRELFAVDVDSDEDQFKGLRLEASLQRCSEIFSASRDRRYDDGDILGQVGRMIGNGDWLKGPVRDTINYQSHISKRPVRACFRQSSCIHVDGEEIFASWMHRGELCHDDICQSIGEGVRHHIPSNDSNKQPGHHAEKTNAKRR